LFHGVKITETLQRWRLMFVVARRDVFSVFVCKYSVADYRLLPDGGGISR